MRNALLAAAAILVASGAAAMAGEGNGDPFAFQVPGLSTTEVAGRAGSDANPFPYTASNSAAQYQAGRVGSDANPFPYAVSGQTYTMGNPDASGQLAAHAGAATTSFH